MDITLEHRHDKNYSQSVRAFCKVKTIPPRQWVTPTGSPLILKNLVQSIPNLRNKTMTTAYFEELIRLFIASNLEEFAMSHHCYLTDETFRRHLEEFDIEFRLPESGAR
jgi:hypothetical protein